MDIGEPTENSWSFLSVYQPPRLEFKPLIFFAWSPKVRKIHELTKHGCNTLLERTTSNASLPTCLYFSVALYMHLWRQLHGASFTFHEPDFLSAAFQPLLFLCFHVWNCNTVIPEAGPPCAANDVVCVELRLWARVSFLRHNCEWEKMTKWLSRCWDGYLAK